MDHWKGITVESGRGKRPGFEGFVCLCASLAIQWNVSSQDMTFCSLSQDCFHAQSDWLK